jgi:hypothetical protein
MSSKKSIPKVLKDLCWKKWVGENISKIKCLCCEDNEIKMSSFHCGHVIPEVNGGKLSIDNLRPICAACNLSMGSENMIDFKKRCNFGSIDNLKIKDVIKTQDISESKEITSENETTTNDVIMTIFSYRKFNSIVDIPLDIFIPNVQRNIIKEHVESMRKHIREYVISGREPVFGALDFVLYNGAYYLVDGQHRYTAIQKELLDNDTVVPIHAMIYEVYSEDMIEEIFKIRNKGIPVPKFMLSIKESKKDVLKEAATYLETLCPAIFKHKGGLLRPKINIETFLEHFRVAPFFKSVITLNDFIHVFNLVNQECFGRLCAMDDKEKRKHGITEHMIELWSTYKIYIGYNKDFDFLNDIKL